MLDIKNFILLEYIDILLEGVDDHQPKDGRWDSPLGAGSSSAKYRFNVDGDACGTPQAPCYHVNISGDGTNGVSISFSRNGSYSDENKGVGMAVFRGVLKALGEYVNVVKPAKMMWSPVTKSVPNKVTGTIINPDARASVYDGWAIRHLFPDKYVGMKNNWIRRDIYDSEYIPNGYPPIPEGITQGSSAKEKSQALEALRTGIEQNQATIRQHEEERRRQEQQRREEEQRRRYEEEERQREERRRRQEQQLQDTINNPQHNQDSIRVGDIVYVADPEHDRHERIGKVERMQMGDSYYGDHDEDGDLHALIRYQNNEDDHEFTGTTERVAVSQLRKETPESGSRRDERRRAAVAELQSNPTQNPGGVNEGDEIITYMPENPHSTQNGLLGKLMRLQRSGGVLMAKVEWDDHAKEVLGERQMNKTVNVKFLKKATPEQIAQIHRDRRAHDIEQEVERSRRRFQGGGPQVQNNAEIEELVNHPANPNHLRPGDYVKAVSGVRWRDRDRTGILVRLEKDSWSSDRLNGWIQFHGSRAEPTRVWNLDGLVRDESPEAASMRSRAAAAEERRTRLTTGAGGRNIGDPVTVATGVHRGKTGRILSFRQSGQNVSVVVASHEGNFTVSVRALQPVAPAATPPAAQTPPGTPPPATESFNLSFGGFLRRRLLG
jgi:hypothetical protein